jgi:hypothetical protein
VFPHVSDVIVAELGSAPAETCTCRLLQCGSTVMQARIFRVGENDLVFIATVESIQVSCGVDAARQMRWKTRTAREWKE